MRKLALLAQWAGDFDAAQREYDELLAASLDKGDPVEARLLYGPQVLCQLIFSMESTKEAPLRILKEMTAEKMEQANELFAARANVDPRKKDLLQAALRFGEKVTARAIKRLMVMPRGEKHALDIPPHRVQLTDRAVSVFTHPHGLEARSYYRGDIALDVKKTMEKLTSLETARVLSHTDRMLEVQIGDDTLEVFLDGRIRCISNGRDARALVSLVELISRYLVAEG